MPNWPNIADLDQDTEHVEIFHNDWNGQAVIYKADGRHYFPCRTVDYSQDHAASCLDAWRARPGCIEHGRQRLSCGAMRGFIAQRPARALCYATCNNYGETQL